MRSQIGMVSPGKAGEQLLPGPVGLAHDDVHLAGPGPVQVAELAVAVPVRVLLPVLQPQQLQGDVLAPQLPVHIGPLRQRAGRRGRRDGRIQQPLQPAIVQALGQRPAQACQHRPRHIVRNGGQRDTGRRAHLAPAQTPAEGQPENFTNISHGDAGSGHRRRLLGRGKCPRERSVPHTPRAGATPPPAQAFGNPGISVRIRSESLFGFGRNHCSDSVGILTYAVTDARRPVNLSSCWPTSWPTRC